MYDLSGKVALVTGAGGERGIGRAIAIRLAQEGADVIVNDIEAVPYPDLSSSWRGIPQVVEEIEALGRRAEGILADVADAAQVDDMVSQILDRFGHIDILVNNAGSRPGPDQAVPHGAPGRRDLRPRGAPQARLRGGAAPGRA